MKRSGTGRDPREIFKFTLKKDPTFCGRRWNWKFFSLPSSSIFTPKVPAETISFSFFLSHLKTSVWPLSISLGLEDMHQSIVATCKWTIHKNSNQSTMGTYKWCLGQSDSQWYIQGGINVMHMLVPKFPWWHITNLHVVSYTSEMKAR